MPTRSIMAVQYSFTNLDKRLSFDIYVLVRKMNKVVTSTLELAKFVALRLHTPLVCLSTSPTESHRFPNLQ